MIALVEDRSRTPGLEKRETGSFRNLTWLRTPYILARGGCAVRREEMDQGKDMADQTYFLFFQWHVFHFKYRAF